ncbi:MAG: DUF5106 domain-containing protein [Bacteroidales bacterium]|jgi:thiol-disulfide isomerase/thioredoxin|nr:DUF5106 domain-containing protein [Bacteroidales bacterium]
MFVPFMKKLLALFLLLVAFQAKAQVDISIQLEQANDSAYYLARYYGDKFQMVDTTFAKDGLINYRAADNYHAGIYLLVDAKKTRLMEFLLENDQQFSIINSTSMENGGLKCEGSIMTNLFFEQMLQSNAIYGQLQQLAQNPEQQPERDVLLARLDSLKNDIITRYPDSLFSKILLAMYEPQVPKSLQQDQKAAYYYYKENFWNTIDLSDERLLRTPIINSKLEQYFEQLLPQIPDTISNEIDKLIEKTQGNLVMRDYLIWHFTDQYQNPKVMGLDQVFIHLADEYFAKLEITNTSPSVREKIMSRADQIRKLTLGSPAPDLWLVDTTDTFRSFKDIKTEYLILFFWDHDCGVCKKELKVLKELYNAENNDFEVFAIAANADFTAWKNYIIENKLNWVNVNGMKSMTEDFHDLYDIYGTPVIYVLNKERKIIAKRIKAEQIPLVIEHNQKSRQNIKQ